MPFSNHFSHCSQIEQVVKDMFWHYELFNTLRNFLIESYHACLNIAKVRMFFQNTWIRSYHIFMSMVIVGYSFMYQKI
jgi:hypothetical protein